MRNNFLEATDIYLRPLELEDLNEEYVSWLNNPKVCQYNSHHRFPNTKEKTKEYITNSANTHTSLILAICSKHTNEHIGNIALTSINYIDSCTELSILIGKSSEHSKGNGKQAMQLIIQHAFESLNIHRIYCGTSEKNIPMQKLASKLNFHQEGISKEALFKNGHFLDIINYGLINPNHSSCKNIDF